MIQMIFLFVKHRVEFHSWSFDASTMLKHSSIINWLHYNRIIMPLNVPMLLYRRSPIRHQRLIKCSYSESRAVLCYIVRKLC